MQLEQLSKQSMSCRLGAGNSCYTVETCSGTNELNQHNFEPGWNRTEAFFFFICLTVWTHTHTAVTVE